VSYNLFRLACHRGFRRITGGESLRCLNPMRGGVHMDKFFFDFLLIVTANIASGLIMLAIRGILSKRKEKRCPPCKDEHR